MKRTSLLFVLALSALGQSVSGTAGQSAPGNKSDDQADKTATPKGRRNRNTNRRDRSDTTTVPPVSGERTTPLDPSMPTDPKTPTNPTVPRTPIKPTDPTRPEDPTKPTVPPPVV